LDDLNPTITPVLDLTAMETEARRIGGILTPDPLAVGASTLQANRILVESVSRTDEATADPKPTEIKFEQNVYSPQALTPSDIYRNTKNLLEFEKDKLVPSSA
jgi:hypothetical protein